MFFVFRSPTFSHRCPILLAVFFLVSGRLCAQINGPVWAKPPASPQTADRVPAPTPKPAAAPPPAGRAAPSSLPAAFPVSPTTIQAPRITTALAENRAAQLANPRDVGLKIQEARYLSWLSRHYTAANRYRAILREHPDHVDALTGYGNALFWQSDWRNSYLALADAAAKAAPNDLAPHIAHLRVLGKQGQASSVYQQAVELDRRSGQRDAELGLLIADQLAAVGQRSQGLPYVDRPTIDPDLRIRQAEYRAAQAAETNGRRAVPALAQDLVNRSGRLYNSFNAAGDLLAKHRFDREALAYYEQAIRLEPEREEARLGKARVLRTRGRHGESLQAFQAVTQHNPESLNGWIGVAEMSRFEGDPERAWQALDTALTISPAAADVFKERLRLASSQDDEERFQSELARYRQAQPHDPWVDLIAARRQSQKHRPVNEAALRRLLDPMAPDINAEVAQLVRESSGAGADTIAAALPPAPDPELDAPAGAEVHRRLKIRVPDSVNLTTGYEFSSLKPTTTLPGTFPDWHEAYFAGFWRRTGGQMITFDYRHYERFGANAQQLQAGILQPLRRRWTVGGHFGGALFGTFIPHWRLGAEAGYQATERLGLRLEYRHLRFTDQPLHQFIPEATWQWHPRFHSTTRLYVTHAQPAGSASDTGLTAYFDLAYRVASNSHVKVHYANGKQNASALVQALIGEQNFQSTGVELRLGLNERWAITPSYRFERHALFDLHAVALSLNGRF